LRLRVNRLPLLFTKGAALHRLPASLTKQLSAAQLVDVRDWWRSLSTADKSSMRDARPPPGLVARFVEPGAFEPDATTDFFEYLVNHEISLEDGSTRHICSAHAEAREVIRGGVISAGFVCPLARTACPMRALLDEGPGCDLRLSRCTQ
jgi:hypothetical protein